MDIKVLGAGCANCNKLEQMVFDVLAEQNIDASVTHVRDFKDIASYGVMSTPALVIDGQVKFSGVVPSKAKLAEVIMEAAKRG
ncbi:redox-active disulfide protein 2 [Thermincola ferriacetica]|uniref:Redox-active disulfide protein 2 n=1 Tax=Thermincola ferriacetica TaxID=281456 RepID=A0A0L6W256_9FIRM|nr:thioredoxin family protein [Thermincola ferriacetica]KNZ69164.1 redox-active disulfide protein 2 [Thermincola ferriacetica]